MNFSTQQGIKRLIRIRRIREVVGVENIQPLQKVQKVQYVQKVGDCGLPMLVFSPNIKEEMVYFALNWRRFPNRCLREISVVGVENIQPLQDHSIFK